MLSDNQISTIVRNELDQALAYEGEIAKKRARNLDFYNAQPYGDEVDGQSSVVTTDVADVVEWMLPSLLRVFTQGKNIAVFEGNTSKDEQEATDKTFLANYTFLQENNGVLVLHDMFKDALLQYTGTVKVYWDDHKDVKTTKYQGMSQLEYQKLLLTPGITLEDVEIVDTDEGQTYNAKEVKINQRPGVKYMNVPPEEFLVSKSARSFEDAVFIGHRSPKTRSDLIKMGFDRKTVDNLSADERVDDAQQKSARYHDHGGLQNNNPGSHSPNDIIYLGEYYIRMDVNQDGITELWQVMHAGDEVLSKEEVEDHPFAVCVPVPIPHRAIGTCPAEQVADIQFRKSTLVRQMLNNIYQSNFPRVLHSNKVELDDLLTPRAGGSTSVDTDHADVAGHAQLLQITPMVEPIMAAIEMTNTEREIRTGMTRYSQGMDGESLNKTATGFLGIKDASQQRMDLIARVFADGGVRQLFEKTVNLLSKYQDTSQQLQVMGKEVEIDPHAWGENSRCRIDVGLGSGDRQEKIMNLNTILQQQMGFIQQGLVIADQQGMYSTLDKIITEIGLKDVSTYFNNPEVPEETLFAQNQQLAKMVQQMQAEIQNNPLADAEKIRAQAKLIEAKTKDSQFMSKLDQDEQKMLMDYAAKLTEMELKYGADVPGSVV